MDNLIGKKVRIPAGYKTWFMTGEPPVAEFVKDTTVTITEELNPYWLGAKVGPEHGFPPNVIGIHKSDIKTGKVIKVM